MAGSSGLWGDARDRGGRFGEWEGGRSGGVGARAGRPCWGRPKKHRPRRPASEPRQRMIDAVVTPVVGSADPALQRWDMSHATVNRREFLKTGAAAGAGLVIGLYLPAFDPGASHAPAAREPFKPNAWIEIRPDGTVTIWTGRSEMGQGVRTAMPMIVAEELEADWTRVRVAQADADPAYGDQFTVGSRSIRSGFEPLRKAGAAAREMLIGAAALTWHVSRDTCRARNGMVEHVPTGRRLGYGELAARAATLPVPADPPLQPTSEFRILGKRMPRLGHPDKVSGAAGFGVDVRVPDMLCAAVGRGPVFGVCVPALHAPTAVHCQ